MKKLIVILFLMLSSLTFSQTKKEPSLDEKINKKLDSLSVLYKKKVFGISIREHGDTITKTIQYVKNNKEYSEVIFLSIKGKRIK